APLPGERGLRAAREARARLRGRDDEHAGRGARRALRPAARALRRSRARRADGRDRLGELSGALRPRLRHRGPGLLRGRLLPAARARRKRVARRGPGGQITAEPLSESPAAVPRSWRRAAGAAPGACSTIGRAMRNPYLVGTKVYLRPLEESDAAECHAWLNDPEVRRTLAVRGVSHTEASSREWIRSRDPRRDQVFAIVTREGG